MKATIKFYTVMLAIIGLVLGYIAYQIMKPFMVPIMWAGVLSIVFYPLYEFLKKKVRWKSIASLITLLTILLIIVGPFAYLAIVLLTEISGVISSLDQGTFYGLKGFLASPVVSWILNKFRSIPGFDDINLESYIMQSISSAGRQVVGKVSAGAMNIGIAIGNFTLMALTIFFFLRDGPDLLKRVRDYLPFSKEQRDRLERLAKDMVVSTVFGGIVVALVQGIMGGVAFYLLGVPSPVMLGTLISIASFIPMIGAFPIWGSMVIYLIMEAAYAKALILLLFGVFGISLIDNILKPIIIGGRTKMPTLLILFSALGGIKFFGLLGIIMGPVCIALFISVLEILREIEVGLTAKGS